MTQSYDVPFWLAGVFLFISAAISFMVPCVSRYIKRKEKKAKAVVELTSSPAKV